MEYQIFGNTLPAVTMVLQPGESIYTQSGGMTWMSDGVTMETNMKGGLMKGLGRMFSGDSAFQATYTATRPNSEICCASTFPGSIICLEVAPGKEYIAQKGAFLCAEPTVQFDTRISKMKSGFFGGEGFILQHFYGHGKLFLELDGSVVVRDLAPGETLKVDTGNVALFEAQVQYDAQMVKGFKNILFGGEGLFLTTVTGPGRVWLQTMTASGLAARIIPYLPSRNND